MDLFLALGTTGLADHVNLDGNSAAMSQYRVPIVQVSTAGTSLPSGLTFDPRMTGFRRQGAQPVIDSDPYPIIIPLLIYGEDHIEREANWAAITRKLQQAMDAAGPDQQGQRVTLWYREEGSPEYTFFIVQEGNLQFTDFGLTDDDPNLAAQIEAGSVMSAILELDCLPWALGTPITENIDLLAGSGDFENPNAVTGWTASGLTSFTQVSTYAQIGIYSGRVLKSVVAGGEYVVSPFIAVAAGLAYTASSYVKRVVNTGVGGFFVNCYDGSFALLTGLADLALPAGVVDWTRITATVVIPATAVYITVGFNTDFSTVGQACDYYVDGVKVEVGIVATRYPPTAVNAGLTATTYSRAIPGNLQSLTRLKLRKTGTTHIQGYRISQRSRRPLAQSAFIPWSAVTPLSPGAAHVNANAIGGTEARVTTGPSWKNVGYVVEPNTGLAQYGAFDVVARLKDSTTPLVAPTWLVSPLVAATPSGAGGNLPVGLYTLILSSYDGSGHESFPSTSVVVFVPYTSTAFFDSFETNDFSAWNNTNSYNILFNQYTANASIVISTDAAYNPAGALQGVYGATVSILGSGLSAAFLQKTVPGAGNTGAVKFNMRITKTDTSTPPACSLVVGFNNATPPVPVVSIQTPGIGVEAWGFAAAGGGIGIPPSPLYNILIPMNAWIDVEIDWSWSAGASGTLVVDCYTQNDFNHYTQTFTSYGAAPINSGFGLWVAGGSGANAVEVQFDQIQMDSAHIGPNKGSIVLNWNAGAGQSGYYLYPQLNNYGVRKVDVTNVVTYTLTAIWTIGTTSVPVTTAPVINNALVRAGYGANCPDLTKAILNYTDAIQTVVGRGLYETAFIATVVLAPQVTMEGQTQPPPWVLILQAADAGSNTPTLDSDGLYLVPHTGETFVEVLWPGANLAVDAIFIIDQRADGRVSCTVVQASDGVTVLAVLPVNGSFSLDSEDNIWTVEALSGDTGQYISNATGAVQWQATIDQVVPRYLLGTGGA